MWGFVENSFENEDSKILDIPLYMLFVLGKELEVEN